MTMRKLKNKKLAFEEFRDKYLLRQHVPVEELVELGILDGLDNYPDVKEKVAGSTKEYHIYLPPGRTRGSSDPLRANNLEYMLNNRFLVV